MTVSHGDELTSDTLTHPVFHGNTGLDAAAMAGLFDAAADLIEKRGYCAFDDYERSIGFSIVTALLTAAEDAGFGDGAVDVAEELSTRLGAVLYLTGNLTRRTNITDMTDLPHGWECGHFGARSFTVGTAAAHEAVELLRTAGKLIKSMA